MSASTNIETMFLNVIIIQLWVKLLVHFQLNVEIRAGCLGRSIFSLFVFGSEGQLDRQGPTPHLQLLSQFQTEQRSWENLKFCLLLKAGQKWGNLHCIIKKWFTLLFAKIVKIIILCATFSLNAMGWHVYVSILTKSLSQLLFRSWDWLVFKSRFFTCLYAVFPESYVCDATWSNADCGKINLWKWW